MLAFLARPLGIAPFLAPLHLRRGERVFVMWSGLKGAVPILLAAFALLEHVPGSERIYGIVFVVVAFSVIVQGGSVPFAARRLGVPMRLVHRRRPVIVAHLDLDAFFAAVEELETPELRAKPLVVGGDPHGRGVVATANYVARRFGIHSAMSCAEALRRCPQAVFVQPRKRLYSEYSKAVWNAVREVVPTVERTGMDEGYLDVGEVAADFGRARAVAEAVQAAVRGATSLSCSLGVSSCKVVSKIASDRRKPGGLTVVPAGREAWFLAPVRRAPAAGRRPARGGAAAARRASTRSATWRRSRTRQLRALLPGKLGPLLRDRARGIDPRPLELSAETVSISAEETFPRDVAEVERLQEELRRLSTHVAERLAASGQAGRTVTTKVRYPDFSIRSRSTSLPVGTDDAERIWELACACLDRALADRPGALRLVGVGVSGPGDAPPARARLALFGAPAGDVADRDDPDRPAVLDDRDVAKAVVEHDLRGVLGRRVGAERERVGGHPLAHAGLARVHAAGDGAGQVTLGDDPDQVAVVGDDRRADAALDHLLRGLADRVGGVDREDVAGHQLADGAHAASVTPPAT